MACKSLSGDLGREADDERCAPKIWPERARPDIEGGGVAEEVLPPPLKYDLIPALKNGCKLVKQITCSSSAKV